MIKANLLREPKSKRKGFGASSSSSTLILVGVFLVVLGLIALWYFSLNAQLNDARTEETRLQQEMLQLQQVRARIAASEQTKERLRERIDLIERLQAGQQGPVQLMNGLLESIPIEPKIWLERTRQNANAVEIEGKAFDVPAIADFMDALAKTEAFSQVELESFEDENESINFRINCRTGR